MTSKTKYYMDDEKKSGSRLDYQYGGADKGVLYGNKLGDRRAMVYEPYKDKRVIIRCIGQLTMKFAKDAHQGYKGTGTVFSVKDGYAYIITCAHNVIQQDWHNDKRKYAVSIEFERAVSKFQVQDYKAEIVAVHDQYQFRQRDPNDLAILKIKDDGYYKKLFDSEPEGIVHIKNSDDIDNKDLVNYGLYGYPLYEQEIKYSIVADYDDGMLFGMDAPSHKMVKLEQNHEIKEEEMYVEKNKQKTQYIYNAIDAQGGQTGSALFTYEKDGKFGIVGIHTCHGYPNSGVALNGNKIKWLNDNIHSDAFDPNCIGSNMKLNEKTQCIVQIKQGSSSAFLTHTFDSKVHHWRFQINKCKGTSNSGGWTQTLGIYQIIPNDDSELPVNTYFTKHSERSYGFANDQGVLISRKNGRMDRDKEYGVKTKAGDIIDMYCDMKKLELRFTINGTDYGKAFDIEPGEYRGAINMYDAEDSIKLLE